LNATVTVVSISHFYSPLFVPNVECIVWNFDGSNFDDLGRLTFKNGDAVPDVENYFV
jgi:hypothetical protein